MAYKSMKRLIELVKAGKSSQSKDELLDKCDVFLTVGRINDTQYAELVASINEIEVVSIEEEEASA